MGSQGPLAVLRERGLPTRRLLVALVGTGAVAGIVLVAVDAGLVTIPEGTTGAAETVLAEYGLLALFLIFVVEGAMLLYFAPSESLVPASIVLLTESLADVAIVVAVATVGATVGQVALFVVARRGGREWILRRDWFPVSERSLDRFDAWFERWGPVVLPVSNTLLFTRGMLTVPAGLSEMDVRTFAVLSAVGTVVFETILAAVTLGLLGWLG